MSSTTVDRKTLTATQAHEELERVAQPAPEVRDCTKLQVGEVARQGDVYLHRVEDTHPRGKARKDRQLALGNTQGSRHIAEEPARVFEGKAIPSWCREGTFLGPLVVVGKGETALVSHPEHAHMLIGEGTWQTTHQEDARSRQRVMD